MINQQEFEQRLDRLRAALQRENLDALVQFSAVNTMYLTGFVHTPTERPIVLVVPVDGEVGMLAPLLERDHITQHVPVVKQTHIYREYPGERHPMAHLGDFLQALGLSTARLGIDSDGYGATFGYRGPQLSAILPNADLVNVRDVVERMRMIKTDVEIDIIRQCVPWGNHLMEIIRAKVQAGTDELTTSLRSFTEASVGLIDEMGENYRGYDNGSIPVLGGFVAGPKTALPHPIDDGRAMEPSDVLIAWGGPRLFGYHAELERTMILGQPNARQEELFNIMVEMQQAAFEAITPGEPCSVVEQAALSVVARYGVEDLLRHHIGHGVGLQIHEAPFLDVGDTTVLEPGMVFSCEPGLYELGLGGFRHSDTVLVTDTGAERITNYPRDLASLIIPE